jgi:hypothetical protein
LGSSVTFHRLIAEMLVMIGLSWIPVLIFELLLQSPGPKQSHGKIHMCLMHVAQEIQPRGQHAQNNLFLMLFSENGWNSVFRLLSDPAKIRHEFVDTCLHPWSAVRPAGCTPTHWTVHVQCLYISCYLSVNKPVLSYLLSRLLPQITLKNY